MEIQKVRLDKWLWAARFFKTRAKAKEAIEGGKVHIDGVRGKPGKDIQAGDQLEIRQGFDEKSVIILGVSAQRRGAPEAQLLYAETEESLRRRETETEQRRILRGPGVHSDHRPNKKERRQIHRFQNINDLD